jgi:hypothetical protein
MIDIIQVTRMHRETVERWHQQEIDNPYSGILELVCRQHRWNFLLWHEEDIARSTSVGDSRIAEAKRNIDRFNQLRNDGIETVDDALTDRLAELAVEVAPDAPLNTETPGSAIDRLSILSLRIYHMEEQAVREDASPEHLASVQAKLTLCREQFEDLSKSTAGLLRDLVAGRKRHKTYRQMKMYNDPNLNPYLYQARQQAAAPEGTPSAGS